MSYPFITQTGLILSDTVGCRTKRVINGEDELEFAYPIDGIGFNDISLETLISAKTERSRGVQKYRIYKITEPMNGIITVFAHHYAYDLDGYILVPGFTGSSASNTVNNIKSSNLILPTGVSFPFHFSTTMTTNATFLTTAPTSVWSIMGGSEGSIIDTYGGEWDFDNENITLVNELGQDRGVSIRYGVNMTDFNQDADSETLYSGAIGYWTRDGEQTVRSDIRLVDNSASYARPRILTIDFSSEFDEAPTQEELNTLTDLYISVNDIGSPHFSWKVSFVPLETTEEFKDLQILETVSLGDRVGVKFEKLGVNAKARVTEIEWDVLLDKYISVTIGSVRADFAQSIVDNRRETAEAINRVPDLAKEISLELTTKLFGGDGPGVLRILDTDNDNVMDTLIIADASATSTSGTVWMFNHNGFGASTSGYSGPFRTGAVANGFLAEFIKAANITAGYIGSSTGENFWNLDTGEFRLSPSTRVYNTESLIPAKISSVKIEYKTSSTDWSETPPTGTAFPAHVTYSIYVRYTVNYANGDVMVYTPSDPISGNTGDYEWRVVRFETEYYLSTSNTSQIGGQWSGSVSFNTDKYVWIKTTVYLKSTTEGQLSTWQWRSFMPIWINTLFDNLNVSDMIASIEDAHAEVNTLDSSLNTTGVFNRLTNNGQLQGIYMSNGDLYINGTYIKANSIAGDKLVAHTITADQIATDYVATSALSADTADISKKITVKNSNNVTIFEADADAGTVTMAAANISGQLTAATIRADKIYTTSGSYQVPSDAISTQSKGLDNLYVTNIFVSGTNATITMNGKILFATANATLDNSGVSLTSGASATWQQIVSAAAASALFG